MASNDHTIYNPIKIGNFVSFFLKKQIRINFEEYSTK